MAKQSPGRLAALERLPRHVLGPLYRALPAGVRRSIRTVRLRYIVKRGRFGSEEPEYQRLSEWLRPGDTAIDVCANFGSYALRMSELVGDQGRVYAFEPVPQSFALLTMVLGTAFRRNVTTLNLACSNRNGLVSMTIPDDPLTGENLYQASIRSDGPSPTRVICSRIDDLPLPMDRLSLVKIDAEGHDAEVIEGMWNIVCRFLPVVIVEYPPVAICNRMRSLGYELTDRVGSPNGVFIHPRRRISEGA